MKKDLFWKIVVVIFLVLMAIWVWSKSIIIIPSQPKGFTVELYKVNKLTGSVYSFDFSEGYRRWIKEKPEPDEDGR